jgi:hypothetical protein
VLATSRFYSPEELFDTVVKTYRSHIVSIEYGPNLYERVEDEHQLRFVCKLVARDHASYIPEQDYIQHIQDTEESAHTDIYEKKLALIRRKPRPRGRKKQDTNTNAQVKHPPETTSTEPDKSSKTPPPVFATPSQNEWSNSSDSSYVSCDAFV